LTLHFIDADWNLISFPAAFEKIIGPHTAEAIGKLTAKLIRPYLSMRN
jgi:hypothetical protein